MSELQDTFIQTILEDEGINQAHTSFKEQIEIADTLAVNITKELMNAILEHDFMTLDLAVLSVARTLIYLGQNYFADEPSFKTVLDHVRDITGDRIAYAIDNPQPCGKCEGCKAKEKCMSPTIDQLMTKRALPLLACSILEYSFWATHMDEELNHSLGN